QGVEIVHDHYFDTILARVPGAAHRVVRAAEVRGINLRLVDGDTVGISCDETTTAKHLGDVCAAFGREHASWIAHGAEAPTTFARTEPFLTHPVFHEHRSETAMLRYLRRLADKDVALDRSMIPLGSCTMKLNATAEMEP